MAGSLHPAEMNALKLVATACRRAVGGTLVDIRLLPDSVRRDRDGVYGAIEVTLKEEDERVEATISQLFETELVEHDRFFTLSFHRGIQKPGQSLLG